MRRLLILNGLVLAGACTSISAQRSSGAIALDQVVRVPPYVANLGAVGQALPTRDGGLAIIDYDANGIRFFSPSGIELGVFGRGGEGPGEFRNLNAIGWSSDTLWVSDSRTRRITFISPQRKLLRMVPYPVVKPTPNDEGVVYSGATIHSVYPDGSMALSLPFARVSKLPAWAAGHTLQEEPVLRVASRQSTRTLFGWIPSDATCEIRYEFDKGFGVVGIPFCESSLWGISPDGSTLVAVTIGPIQKGKHTYQLLVNGSKGETLHSGTHEFVPQVIPIRVADSAMQKRRMKFRDNPAELWAFSSAKIPYAYPPLRSLLIGSDSTIWLEQRRSDSTRRWIALKADGTPAGAIELPANATLVAADRASIWVTETNEDGMAGLAKFTVRRPR